MRSGARPRSRSPFASRLGTPYPQVVAAVADIAGRLDRPALVIDGTAVGRGTVDLFRQADLPVDELLAVTVTAGHQARQLNPDSWVAPKKDLVAAVQSVLQGRRLKIARGLRQAATLTRELSTFQLKTTASASEALDGWREGAHDDLVLAVALAVWLGEFGPPPELNVVALCVDRPPARARPTPAVVFPDVRYFPPYDSFQPLPRIDRQTLRGCPDFKTQEQAAYFIMVFHRALGLPPPEFTVELGPDEQSAVDRKLAEFMQQQRLPSVPDARASTTPAP